jgi:hypothetical protein
MVLLDSFYAQLPLSPRSRQVQHRFQLVGGSAYGRNHHNQPIASKLADNLYYILHRIGTPEGGPTKLKYIHFQLLIKVLTLPQQNPLQRNNI